MFGVRVRQYFRRWWRCSGQGSFVPISCAGMSVLWHDIMFRLGLWSHAAPGNLGKRVECTVNVFVCMDRQLCLQGNIASASGFAWRTIRNIITVDSDRSLVHTPMKEHVIALIENRPSNCRRLRYQLPTPKDDHDVAEILSDFLKLGNFPVFLEPSTSLRGNGWFAAVAASALPSARTDRYVCRKSEPTDGYGPISAPSYELNCAAVQNDIAGMTFSPLANSVQTVQGYGPSDRKQPFRVFSSCLTEAPSRIGRNRRLQAWRLGGACESNGRLRLCRLGQQRSKFNQRRH